MKALFEGMGTRPDVDAEACAQKPRRGTEPARADLSSLSEENAAPASSGEAVPVGWGTEPGEAAEVAAVAREKFPAPPTNRRGFPDFPTFCAGYGKGCGQCRFFSMGRGPFCMVWGEAWPNFQRNAETDTATW